MFEKERKKYGRQRREDSRFKKKNNNNNNKKKEREKVAWEMGMRADGGALKSCLGLSVSLREKRR